jgi:hypothetical protein
MWPSVRDCEAVAIERQPEDEGNDEEDMALALF